MRSLISSQLVRFDTRAFFFLFFWADNKINGKKTLTKKMNTSWIAIFFVRRWVLQSDYSLILIISAESSREVEVLLDMGVICASPLRAVDRSDCQLVSSSQSPAPKKYKVRHWPPPAPFWAPLHPHRSRCLLSRQVNVATQCDPLEIIELSDSEWPRVTSPNQSLVFCEMNFHSGLPRGRWNARPSVYICIPL